MLDIIIKGTAGVKIAGSKPPARAIRLGRQDKNKASLKPTKNRAIINIALTSGPTIHCPWKKKGITKRILAKVKNFNNVFTSTLTKVLAFM